LKNRWQNVVFLVITAGIALTTLTVPSVLAETDGEDEAAWLGVWLTDAVDGGVQIQAVVDGGPAAEAGIRAGDIVFQAGETAVGSEAELGRLLRSMSPGQELALKLLRASEDLELIVALGQRQRRLGAWSVRPSPPTPVEGPAPPTATDIYRAYVYPNLMNPESVGLQVTEITPALRVHYGAPEGVGVLVTRVEPEQLAAVAGLEVGDILVRIGDTQIRSEREVRGNLVRWNVQEPLTVQVIRATKVVEIDVAPRVQTAPTPGLARHPDPRDEFARQEFLKRQLELQIDRLERRLAEMKKELERIEQPD
jgi:S1-C subfamily serine protease